VRFLDDYSARNNVSDDLLNQTTEMLKLEVHTCEQVSQDLLNKITEGQAEGVTL